MHTTVARIGIALIAFALLLAVGCDGDDSGPTTNGGETTTEAVGETTSLPPTTPPPTVLATPPTTAPRTRVTAQVIEVGRRDFEAQVVPGNFTVDAVVSADSLFVFFKVPGGIDDGHCAELVLTDVGRTEEYSAAQVGGGCDPNTLGGGLTTASLFGDSTAVFQVPRPPEDLFDLIVSHYVKDSSGVVSSTDSTFGGGQVDLTSFGFVEPGDEVETKTLDDFFSEGLRHKF